MQSNFPRMAHADSVELLVAQHQTCKRHLANLLPTLITPRAAAAAARGGCLSPCNTVLCIRELRERMETLGLSELQHRPCRVDVPVAIYSIAFKLARSSTGGFRGDDAWRIALRQQPHVWALYVHSARDAGELKHLAGLDVEMRPDWLARNEALLLETLGAGLWDVLRVEAVDAILRCVAEHLDVAACADLRGMVDPPTVDMYFASTTGAVLKAAFSFLRTRLGTQGHLMYLAQTWLNTLDTFKDAFYQKVSEPVHMHDLRQLDGQIETLVHAAVLLCEYVLLCAEADAKPAGVVEPES